MHMTVTRDVAATRQRVWDVLADGWTYSGWVVGNSRIRAVSSNWPAPGSRILHSIGAWPAVIDDETVVESCVSGEELVLLAKVRPAAEARITMRLSDIPGGCRVEMTEVAVSPPLRWVPDSVLARALERCPDAHSAKGKAVIDRGTRTIDLAVTAHSATTLSALTESIDLVSTPIANMLGEPPIATRTSIHIDKQPCRDRVE
jgi:Polyketide cyclase / dehydrase and lipid transport